MKRNLIFIAALICTSAALAQSSVTLFGVADATVKYGRGTAASVTSLGSGGNATSRIGFRGVEDLGGGMSAAFHLEAGYTVDSGLGQASSTNNQTSGALAAGGLNFNRQSTLSLSGTFGEIRLGRDRAATYRNIGDSDPFGDVGVGNTLMDSPINLSSITKAVRVSNSVNYFLPSKLGGVYGQAQYFMGENSADVSSAGVVTAGKKDGTGSGLRLGYEQGALNVAIAYGETKFRSVSATTGDQNTMNIVGNYIFDSAKLMTLYNVDQVKTPTMTQKGVGYLVGLSVPVGAGEIRTSYASYRRKEGLSTGEKQADKFALGYVHHLSKRTAIYSTIGFLKNKNGAGQVLNGAALAGGNDKSSGIDFGLRHIF